MTYFLQLFVLLALSACAAVKAVGQPPKLDSACLDSDSDCLIVPNRTNAIQFRLFTNAAPSAPHLFNTFEIEAFGKTLLTSPDREYLRQWLLVGDTNNSLHSVLINGLGPDLASTNAAKIVEAAAGPDWCYVALDLAAAYQDRLNQYQRSILFVAPDLFVLHDRVVGREPVRFELLLHPPAATRLDPDWHDLRLETPLAGLRINAPSRGELRTWERVQSTADSVLPDTITTRIGPTNKVSQIDLLTVFAIQPAGKPMDYVFKLVESNSAVGARIHRDGAPTLVAFRTHDTGPTSSLDSFKFSGPVGVAVFQPKRSRR